MIKDLGQNYLVDTDVLRDIIDAAELKADDVVLEIGAGRGILTDALAKHVKRVVAIELDQALIPNLVERFVKRKNVEIVHADFLRWWGEGAQLRSDSSPASLDAPARRLAALRPRSPSLRSGSMPARPSYAAGEQSVRSCFTGKSFKVVANLPYGITSHALRVLLEHEPRPSMMVVMVQKEVAERVCAKPGDMSLLSLGVQWFGKPEIVRIVPPESFDPAPNVESAILRIRAYLPASLREVNRQAGSEEQVANSAILEKRVFQLARIGFASRRKQLHNQLASGLHISPAVVQSVLESLGASAKARAQELSIEQWMAIAKAFM